MRCSHFMSDLSKVICNVDMERTLPCGHSATMACSRDPETYQCSIRCGAILKCCGRDCAAACYECDLSDSDSEQNSQDHKMHLCKKQFFCQHGCDLPCSEGHECSTICSKACRQECVHTRCKEKCSDPCSPCQQPCTWYDSKFCTQPKKLTN